jgi:hypothetical protein
MDDVSLGGSYGVANAGDISGNGQGSLCYSPSKECQVDT